MQTSRVAIVRCPDYTETRVEAALRQSLALIGGIENLVRPGNRVLLKVNLLSPKTPEQAVTTHPAVVAALARLAREAGGEPVVGDSSGGILAGRSPTARALAVSGVAEAAAANGAAVVNFDTSGVVEVDNSGNALVPVLHLSREVLAADVVISVPKLKTHSATLYTGTVKNMFGAVPGRRKAEYHRLAPSLEEFSGLLVDIYAAAKPHLTVMDGILAMEGNGPAHGQPRPVGLILSSRDGIALDAVAAAVIGFRPGAIASTRIGAARGLGQGSLEQIEVVGESLATAKVQGFRLPSNALFAHAPRGLVRGALQLLQTRPVVNRRKCSGCQACRENCPVGAITWKEGAPQVDLERCIQCFCCHELCPAGAMEFRRDYWVARQFARLTGRNR